MFTKCVKLPSVYEDILFCLLEGIMNNMKGQKLQVKSLVLSYDRAQLVKSAFKTLKAKFKV